jgi:hypothetical protein
VVEKRYSRYKRSVAHLEYPPFKGWPTSCPPSESHFARPISVTTDKYFREIWEKEGEFKRGRGRRVQARKIGSPRAPSIPHHTPATLEFGTIILVSSGARNIIRRMFGNISPGKWPKQSVQWPWAMAI